MALFFEAKINTEDRNNLPDSAFGLPSKRKYPLTDKDGNLDEKHVLQAVRFFNKADESDKPELAKNILKAAKKLDMDYSNWKDILKYAGKEDVIKESYTKDLHSTPEADKIFVYLNENVKYDNASPEIWRLKSPDELIDHKKGNCHDTAWYVFNKLEEYAGHEVDKGILFFIEYKEGNNEGGQTHSVCYEKIPGGICIIECSWEGMTGTFPYDDIDEYISVVKSKWKFTGDNDKLYATEIKNTSRIHPGMTLGEYVSVAMRNKEIITESYDPQPDDGDHTSGTSDFDRDDKDPDDCFCESGNNVSETQAFYKRWFDNKAKEDLKLAKEIAKRIHEKYEADKQPPCGNQNCQVCVWCAEAQFRGRTDMPRPVYSPRDPVLNILGESIVIRPRVFSMKAGFDDVLNMLSEHPYARFYCHVKWKEGHGGHEFIIITAGENKSYIMDPQQGTVDKFLETHPYIKDLKWEDSYLSRMDNAEFNETVLRDFNTEESIVPWDAKLDIPFMLKEGLLSEEEAEKYWKEHPDEAPNDGISESKNIFTSGDFDKYGKDVDLTDARGPITESKKIIDSRDERTLSRLICEGWKIAGTINNEYILIQEGYEDTNDFPAYVGFRPATEKDLDMILEWTLETINDEYRHNQKVIDMINDENRENINTIKIIVDGVKDIGMYQAYPIDEGEWWYLAEIYLIPEYRGKGIGSYLIKKDIESHDKLVLRVNPDNVRAIKLYESLGFVITEKEENSWIMRLDKTKRKTKYQPSNVFTLEEYKKAKEYRSVIVGEIHNSSMLKYYDKLLSERKPEYFISEFAHEDRVLSLPELKQKLDMATNGEFKPGIPDYQDNYAIYKLAYDHGCKLIGCDLNNGKHYDRMHDEDNEREAYMLKVLEEFENTNFVCQLGDHHLRSIPITKEFLDYCGDTKDDRGIVSDLTVDNASPIWTHFTHEPKDVAILREPNELKNEMDFINQQTVQEGYWQDIKNGVNPKSKKLWFHVSFDDKLDEKGPMTPRIPSWLEDIKKDGYTTSDGKKTHDLEEVMRDTGRYENYTTPRVCFSPSIEGALNSILNMWKLKSNILPGKQLYVYIPEKPLSQYKHKTNKELIKDKEVFDAGTTGESWILEPVKVKFYGSIKVDEVKDNGRKHKVLIRPGFEKETDNPMDNYIGRFTYKWHWMIHPSIIKQGEKYEKSEK